jgi:hypothetical protein
MSHIVSAAIHALHVLRNKREQLLWYDNIGYLH